MKKGILPLAAVVLAGLLFCSGSGAAAFLPREKPRGIPVHRFWSEVFHHQFLTLGEEEKNHLIATDSNWRYDGIAYYAFNEQLDGTTPVYRFWSDVFKGHFFTIDEAEREATTINPDWRYEGIAYYVYPDNGQAPADTIPVYRLWSDQSHFMGHFYTSFFPEVQALDKTENYRYEGVAFRGVASPSMCKKIGTMMSPYQDDWSSPPPYDEYKQGIIDYNALMARKHNIVMFFASWENAEGMYGFGRPLPAGGERYQAGWLANQIAEAGATPMITWEPWREGGGIYQSAYLLDNITFGNYDYYLYEYANDVKAWGKPVLLRMMHEMNGNYYPWSCTVNSGDPGKYVAAFRHVVDIFRDVGANNACFVWSPNYASPPAVVGQCADLTRLYPGDEYVDFIGVSAYNWGRDTSRGPGWSQLKPLLDDFLDTMARHFPGKEIIVAETGTSSDAGVEAAAQWLGNTFDYIATRGTVSGVVYFDDFAYHSSGHTDFRVSTGHDWGWAPVDSRITGAYRQAVSGYCD